MIWTEIIGHRPLPINREWTLFKLKKQRSRRRPLGPLASLTKVSSKRHLEVSISLSLEVSLLSLLTSSLITFSNSDLRSSRKRTGSSQAASCWAPCTKLWGRRAIITTSMHTISIGRRPTALPSTWSSPQLWGHHSRKTVTQWITHRIRSLRQSTRL